MGRRDAQIIGRGVAVARQLRVGLSVAVIGAGVLVGLFSQFQRQMVFPGPVGVSAPLLSEVATKVGATELRIPTEDGETLYGWHRAAVWSG